MDSPTISLILPAYNEAESIVPTVMEWCEYFAGLGETAELLVVDDGSRDATAMLVEELAAIRPEVRLLRHGNNRGYGAALRSGFEAARGEWVAFTDADGQFFPEDWARLWSLRQRQDVVAGFRIDRQDPALRRFYSWGYNCLVRILLGTRVKDVDCALKLFRREVLPGLLPNVRGFLVNTEMLRRAWQHKLRLAEVGVRHRPRLAGISKVGLSEIPRVFLQLARFCLQEWIYAPQEVSITTPQPAHSGRTTHQRFPSRV